VLQSKSSQYIYTFTSYVCIISDQGTGDKGDLVTLALVCIDR